ncbi:CLUMA_CG013110, isoform A [Clunio marinus]|uniref:CLUMA_CG013110, isoform A n=1 Tax=Clunio marinus TaxID=568069 RepID=A0A1J1IJ60_9DIPT|nr:CLUMA_CG013110, isoform A [Clunio marinus]
MITCLSLLAGFAQITIKNILRRFLIVLLEQELEDKEVTDEVHLLALQLSKLKFNFSAFGCFDIGFNVMKEFLKFLYLLNLNEDTLETKIRLNGNNFRWVCQEFQHWNLPLFRCRLFRLLAFRFCNSGILSMCFDSLWIANVSSHYHLFLSGLLRLHLRQFHVVLMEFLGLSNININYLPHLFVEKDI